MKSEDEICKLLNMQNGIIKEILSITKKIYTALSEKKLDNFSMELDRRQGLFVRVKEIHESVQPTIQTWRKKEDVPRHVIEFTDQTRKIMGEILELDAECQKAGEEFKNTLADGVNKARTSKKINNGYKTFLRGNSRFLNGKI